MAAPELELAPDDAERLAKAAQEVAKQYPLIASPKAQAWGQFMIVCGMVYVPRGIAIWDRRRQPSGSPLPAPQAAAGNGVSPTPQAGRAAATPSEADPISSLLGQTAAGMA